MLKKSERPPDLDLKAGGLVSVVIPTFNRKESVHRTIESALNQNYSNYEIIVVDDASSDGTTDHIAECFPNVKLLCLDENGGVSRARNAGIEVAQGDYVAFLDSDDEWGPDYLAKQIDCLNENPKAALVFCNYTKITDDWAMQFMDTEPKSGYNDLVHHLLVCPFITTMSVVVVRRENLIKAGLFDSELRSIEDRDLYLRLAFEGELLHNAEDLATRRIGSDNLSGDFELWAKSLEYLVQKFFADDRSKPYRYLRSRTARQQAYNSLVIAKSNSSWLLATYHAMRYTSLSLLHKDTAKELLGSSLQKAEDLARRFLPGSIKTVVRKTITIPYRKNLAKNLETPTSLVLFVTTKCNLQCMHCFYIDELNNPTVEDISLTKIRVLAASLKHQTTITMGGGEPFIRKDITQVCEAFLMSGNVTSISIVSNGSISTADQRCKEILDLPNLENLYVQLSVDGLAETHDRIRQGTKAFERVMSTVEQFSELKKSYPRFRFDVHTIIMKDNLDEIEDLIDHVSQYQIEHKFSFFRGSHTVFDLPQNVYSGFNSDSEDQGYKEADRTLTLEEMRRVYDLICAKNEKSPHRFLSDFQKKKLSMMIDIVEAKKRILPCFAGKIGGVVYSNGDVALCEETTPIGNLETYDHNLHKLWNSNKANEMREKIQQCECIDACNVCNSLTICRP